MLSSIAPGAIVVGSGKDLFPFGRLASLDPTTAQLRCLWSPRFRAAGGTVLRGKVLLRSSSIRNMVPINCIYLYLL